MIIYKGKESVSGLQLTIDRKWRYAMTAEDTLTVKVADSEGTVIETTLTNSAVDSIDKIVTVIFSPEQTALLKPGTGKMMAYMNDLVVLPAQKIKIEEVI